MIKTGPHRTATTRNSFQSKAIFKVPGKAKGYSPLPSHYELVPPSVHPISSRGANPMALPPNLLLNPVGPILPEFVFLQTNYVQLVAKVFQ